MLSRYRMFSFFSLLIFVGFYSLQGFDSYKQYEKVYLYANGSSYCDNAEHTLKKFNLSFQRTEELKDNGGLYILFNAGDLKRENLPKYYVVYQTYDLVTGELGLQQLGNDYVDILKGAIAVWDYSRANIDCYKNNVLNYYYFPADYEYADPVILPCFLPSSAFAAYKDLLINSNQVDAEISSLIPMLFFHSFIQKPKLIIEAGVCYGDSTKAFKKTCQLLDSKLIGLDIDSLYSKTYSGLSFATFLCMDDRLFGKYYANSELKNSPLDIVFIDTSHEYQHTLDELNMFVPLLARDGMLMFHDANITPLLIDGRRGWWCLTNTIMLMGYDAQPSRGVAPAIKSFFGISFDETKYLNFDFYWGGAQWHLIHYPFCNGLTVIKRLLQNN